MSITEFYYNEMKKGTKKNTMLNSIHKKPVKETGIGMPTAQVFHKDIYYQADLLYMPHDNGYKYILVCVDLYDGTLDAQELTDKRQADVIEAFKQIFSRDYLKFPKFITFDQGSEFGSDVKEYFNKHNTIVKYALTGRHRQVANVERANQKISKILLRRMANEDLVHGEEGNNNWVSDLHELIDVLNQHKKKPLTKEIYDEPLIDDNNSKMLTIGENVRLQLDYPINNTSEQRLHGKFREGDARWTKKTYKITDLLLKPGFPPMYLTDAKDNVARTKNQLNVVSKNEIQPDAKYDRRNHEYFNVEKIVDKKIENRKTYYLIKWVGYDDTHNSWEHASTLDRTQDLKNMKSEYNRTHA